MRLIVPSSRLGRVGSAADPTARKSADATMGARESRRRARVSVALGIAPSQCGSNDVVPSPWRPCTLPSLYPPPTRAAAVVCLSPLAPMLDDSAPPHSLPISGPGLGGWSSTSRRSISLFNALHELRLFLRPHGLTRRTTDKKADWLSHLKRSLVFDAAILPQEGTRVSSK